MSEPRRYAKGAAKREEILRLALEVIAEHGYHRSTLRQIAGLAGLSNAGLLHYFQSKEHLLAEVLRLRDEASLTVPYEGDAVDQLIAIVRVNTGIPGLVQLYSSLAAEAVDPSHGAHGFFAERFELNRRRLAEAFRQRRLRGGLAAHLDPEVVASAVIAAADGLQTQWMLDPGLDMAATLETMVRGLGTGRQTRSRG